MSSKPEFKIELRPILNGNYVTNETIVLLTSNPDGDLDEWLATHYRSGGLEAFKYKTGYRGQADELISKNEPQLRILIETYRLIRTDPRNIVRIGKSRRWVPSPSR